MKLHTAETIIPRITAVTAIREKSGLILGWSSRCDCGSREDHLYSIDGTNRARRLAVIHSQTHNCRKNATPWAGNLEIHRAKR